MTPLKRFRAECKGSVAMVFALAALPILVGSGMAIDYSRAVARRASLQNALDSALLAASRLTGNQSDEQLKAFIVSYISASEFGTVQAGDITLSRQGQTLTATVAATVETTLMALAGIEDVSISVSTRATWGKAEVVLVLDNSSTMASSGRMSALKTAAASFVDRAGGTAAGSTGSVNIGLMPYAVSARVPANGSYNGVAYKNAPWILFTGGSFDDRGLYCTSEDDEDAGGGEDAYGCTTYTSVTKSSWTGCIKDRLWNLDTHDGFHNNHNARKYPARQTCRTNETNLQTVFPLALPSASLSSHFSGLKSHINGMQAGGGANMTIGVAWGHAMLSTHDPFIGGSDPNTRRIIILVSASANSGAHVWSSQAVADGRTQMACTAAKSAGIEIYTVSLSMSTTNDALLRSCASKSSNFFDVSDTSQLDSIFETLALAVRRPWLTH